MPKGRNRWARKQNCVRWAGKQNCVRWAGKQTLSDGQEKKTFWFKNKEIVAYVTYVCNKKSLNLSTNIFLDSAVANDTDLVLPIIIHNNFPWSPSHSCICLLTCFRLAFSIKHLTVSHSSLQVEDSKL